MVGKIQDIVSASIVAGAAERIGGDTSARVMTEKPEADVVQKTQNSPKAATQYDAYVKNEDEDLQEAQEKEDKEPMDEKTVS